MHWIPVEVTTSLVYQLQSVKVHCVRSTQTRDWFYSSSKYTRKVDLDMTTRDGEGKSDLRRRKLPTSTKRQAGTSLLQMPSHVACTVNKWRQEYIIYNYHGFVAMVSQKTMKATQRLITRQKNGTSRPKEILSCCLCWCLHPYWCSHSQPEPRIGWFNGHGIRTERRTQFSLPRSSLDTMVSSLVNPSSWLWWGRSMTWAEDGGFTVRDILLNRTSSCQRLLTKWKKLIFYRS